VQRVGSRRWRTLKEMIEAETAAAAAKEAAPRPAPPPPPAPKPAEPPARVAEPEEAAATPGANVPILPPEALDESEAVTAAAAAAEEEIEIPAEQEIAIPVDQEIAIPVEPEIAKPMARAPVPPPPKTPIPPPPRPVAPLPTLSPAGGEGRVRGAPQVVDLGDVARSAAETVPLPPVPPVPPVPPRPAVAAPAPPAAKPAPAIAKPAPPTAKPAPAALKPIAPPPPERLEVVPLAAIDLGDVARSAVTVPFAGFTPPRIARPPGLHDDMPIIPLKPLDEEEEEDVLEELDLIEEPPPQKLPALPSLAPIAKTLTPIAQTLTPIAKTLLGNASAWVTRVTAPRPPRPETLPPPPISELPSLRLAPLEEERGKVRSFPIRKILIGAAAATGLVVVGAGAVWLSSLGLFTRKSAPPTPAPAAAPSPQDTAPPVPPELQAAADQLPHLAPQTIKLVSSVIEPGPPEPPEVFRRAQLAAKQGAAALPPEEAQELRSLRNAVVGSLRSVDRERVLAYDRVTAGRDLMVGEDARVLRLYARGVRSLSPPRRERLQVLLGKAIAASLGRTPVRVEAAAPAAASR